MRYFVLLALLAWPVASWADDPNPSSHLRHRLGVQLGGSGVFQFAYRLRTVGPVFFDVGAGSAPHAGNGSIGLVVDVMTGQRWSLYLGGGAGGAMALGQVPVDDQCDVTTEECEYTSSTSEIGFFYFRAGVSVYLGDKGKHVLGFDVGLWDGVSREREGDVVTERESFTIPMGGASYLYAF